MKRLCKCFKIGNELLCYVEFEENQETYHCLQKAREYFKDDSINGTQLFDERFDLFNETIPLLSICDDEFKRSLLKFKIKVELLTSTNNCILYSSMWTSITNWCNLTIFTTESNTSFKVRSKSINMFKCFKYITT